MIWNAIKDNLSLKRISCCFILPCVYFSIKSPILAVKRPNSTQSWKMSYFLFGLVRALVFNAAWLLVPVCWFATIAIFFGQSSFWESAQPSWHQFGAEKIFSHSLSFITSTELRKGSMEFHEQGHHIKSFVNNFTILFRVFFYASDCCLCIFLQA